MSCNSFLSHTYCKFYLLLFLIFLQITLMQSASHWKCIPWLPFIFYECRCMFLTQILQADAGEKEIKTEKVAKRKKSEHGEGTRERAELLATVQTGKTDLSPSRSSHLWAGVPVKGFGPPIGSCVLTVFHGHVHGSCGVSCSAAAAAC